MTSFPNGHKAKTPNLNVCKPKGMPMMVNIKIKLATI